MRIEKEMNINYDLVQARRLKCQHCGENFVMSYGENARAFVRFSAMEKDKDLMSKGLKKKFFENVKYTCTKKEYGVASCPHCGKFQKWMTGSSYMGLMGCFSVLLILLSAAVAFGICYIMELSESLTFTVMLLSGLAGLLIGLFIGAGAAKKRLYQNMTPEKDLRSMTDNDFIKFINACEKEEADPFIKWRYDVLGHRRPEKGIRIFSLGFIDFTGGLKVPENLLTENKLKELEPPN